MEAPQNHPKKMLRIGNQMFSISQLNHKSLSVPHITKEKSWSSLQNQLNCVQMYKQSMLINSLSDRWGISCYKIHNSSLMVDCYKQIHQKWTMSQKHQICSTMINDQIYIFVSRQIQQQIKNHIIKINTNTWKYEQFNIDNDNYTQRQYNLFETINNSFILIYGGINLTTDLIQQDAYIFKTNNIEKLNIINPIQTRIKFATVQINSKVYIHGGKTNSTQNITYFQQLYEITLDQVNLSITFKLIKPKNQIPFARSNHSMTKISQRYLLMYGGETDLLNIISQNQTSHHKKGNILTDCWIFDIFQKQWTQAKINNNNITPKINSIIKCHKNNIFIFGGQDYKNSHKFQDNVLTFPHVKDVNKNKKKNQFKQKFVLNQQDLYYNKNIQLSVNLIHSASYNIQFPFQAIQKIIQYAQLLQSNNFRIFSQSSTNTFEKFLYICFQFDGLIKHKNNNNQKNIMRQFQNLQFYCFRLGKTMLYVQNNEYLNQRHIFLSSADSKFTPLIDHKFISYEYIQDLRTGLIISKQGQRNKQIIIKILNSLVQNPYDLISSIKNSKICIFSPNLIPALKTYYYELIFEQQDIGIVKNANKINFLQKIKYQLSNNMEFSLKKYLNYIKSTYEEKDMKNIPDKQNKNMNIYFNSSIQQINQQNLSYSNILHQYYNNSRLYQLQININDLKYVNHCKLYLCNQDYVLPQNNGILIYQNNQLINRYECNFGQLMNEKFYKKKYSNKPQNIFYIVGEIHVSNQLKLINFNTQIQNSKKYIKFQKYLSFSINLALKKLNKKVTKSQIQQKTITQRQLQQIKKNQQIQQIKLKRINTENDDHIKDYDTKTKKVKLDKTQI